MTLEVHGDVEHPAAAEADEQQARHRDAATGQRRHGRGRGRQAEDLDRGSAERRSGGAEAVDEPAGQGQADDRTDREGEEGEPELPGGETELVLDVRHRDASAAKAAPLTANAVETALRAVRTRASALR